MTKVGFIGAGNMASAIIDGMLSKNLYLAENIGIYDVNETAREAMKKRGVNVLCSIEQILAQYDIVFLAVKPQTYPTVLEECAKYVPENKLFVSIAAGISTAYIQNAVGASCCVVRAMPNTPLMLSMGATALCCSDNTAPEQFKTVKEIFEASGLVCELCEDKMNAVICVNGSSPAYVYLFAKAIIDGAAAQGIDNETASRLIIQTLRGSAEMLEHSGLTPDQLIKMVSSPGGTTLKALEVLYNGNFEQNIKDAMQACTDRAVELGK